MAKQWGIIRRWREDSAFRASTKVGVIIAIIFYFLGLVSQPFIVPKIEYALMPQKELQITVAQIQSLDELTGLLKYDKVMLFYGRGIISLNFLSDLKKPEEIKDEYVDMVSTTEARTCENCTYYWIKISNRGEDINEPLIISVDLVYDFIRDRADSKIEIVKEKNFLGKNNFLIKINGGIRGNKSETLEFLGHTTKEDNLNFNCDNIKKSKCLLVRYKERDIRNPDKITSFLESLKIELPEYSEEVLKQYILNEKTRKFEEDNRNIKQAKCYFSDDIYKDEN